VTDVAGLLAGNRLVTVAGPGGVGKTRLAGEVARQVADRFADGVWLVELATVRDPALVGAAVAEVLEIPLAAGKPAAESLAGVLGRLQVLVVLDNCEHVLDAAAVLCAELLPAADDVRVLATSREPLGLAGEARYRLAPLELPGPASADGGGGSEAVALFADRARLLVPGFSLDDETGPVVARLVAHLDGMPLAIELAAARVEALGVGQLAERLDDRFGLLVGGDRTAAPRQRSLAAAVDWSYQLLDEPERRVFRHLAIFPGPFTLDAAAAVAGAAAGPAVLHLVDCSLLAPPHADPDGRARYVMLETLRAFGAGRLAEAGEHDGAAAALARTALTVAEHASAGLRTSAGELAAARWLDAEDASIHQALTWALDHDPGAALRLALALAPWWGLRNRWTAGAADLLRAAAGHSSPGEEAWCASQVWLGRAAHVVGDFSGAIGHFTAAYEALAPGGPSPFLADALNGRAESLLILGQITEGTEDARRALALARELRHLAGQARALNNLHLAAHLSGDTKGALDWARQACQADPADISGSLVRYCRTNLIIGLIQVGELEEARRRCTDELKASQEAGDMFVEAQCLSLMAELEWRAGNLTEGWRSLARALPLASRIGAWIMLTDCLDLCGHLCATAGHWAEAVTMWAAFAARLAEDGTIDMPQSVKEREEPMRRAVRALDPAELRLAQERGAAMTLTTAAEFAALLAAQTVPEPAGAPTAQAAPQPAGPPALTGLSPRERELVTLVARGRTDAQIAGQLYISIRTVRSHLDRIRDKSGCRRRADLTRLALQAGLV
jgi:predicted ATPase/DNA-binding CsgD family transcriptional regulator